MTWPWVTCFNALLLGATVALCPAVSNAATVTGEVRLLESKDSAVKKKGDFSSVAVWLIPLGESAVHGVHKHVQMLQKDKKFVPHVLPIETGTTVDFPNLDPIFHNAFSNFNGQIFDVALYPPGTSRKVVFERPGIVRVFCNIHPSMSAIIVVVNSNAFATTDPRGGYVIPNVRPGRYELHVFHERATPETMAKLTRDVTVSAESLHVDPIEISEVGYLPVAHKNKYGLDYPANSDDTGAYSLPIK